MEHGMHNLPQPVRLYYLAPIFRYERPQAGRYRQHYQFGFEALGNADPALDAEVIDMAWQFYDLLGLRALTLQLNNIGCKLCRGKYLQILTQYYSEPNKALCQDCQARLIRNPLRLLDCKNPTCQEIAHAAPKILDYLCQGCDNHFRRVKEYLACLGIPFNTDPYLVRGLDYYTSTVFEIQPEGGGAQSTIGGGGRYDNLIEELGGKPTPAVGFATGIERIILNMQKQGAQPSPIPKPKVYVAYLGEEGNREAIKLIAELRRAGISAIKALGDRSLKAQLKQADTLGVAQVMIIGEEEVKRGSVIVRDMREREQREIPAEKAIALLKDSFI
jgi:histidyl-tRNA synthetase